MEDGNSWLREAVTKGVNELFAARIRKLDKISLKALLDHINPFMAGAVYSDDDMIDQALAGNVHISTGSMFGREFFEPIFRRVPGMLQIGEHQADFESHTNGRVVRYSLKSGPYQQNTGEKENGVERLKKWKRMMRTHREPGELVAVVGTCYGAPKDIERDGVRYLNGPALWEYATGDPEFFRRLAAVLEEIQPECAVLRERYIVAYDRTLRRLKADYDREWRRKTGAIDISRLAKVLDQVTGGTRS